MKKTLLVLSFVLASSTLSYAGTGIPAFTDTGATTPSIPFTLKLSTNVSLNYSVPTGAQGYAAATKHLSGDRAYASANDTSNIYYIGATIGKDIDDAELDNSAALPETGVLTSSAWKSQ